MSKRWNPGSLTFLSFDPVEVSFWMSVASQKLWVKLLGRRWFVTDIEWENKLEGYVAEIKLRSVLELV